MADQMIENDVDYEDGSISQDESDASDEYETETNPQQDDDRDVTDTIESQTIAQRDDSPVVPNLPKRRKLHDEPTTDSLVEGFNRKMKELDDSRDIIKKLNTKVQKLEKTITEQNEALKKKDADKVSLLDALTAATESWRKQLENVKKELEQSNAKIQQYQELFNKGGKI